jgi:hypothetical protein
MLMLPCLVWRLPASASQASVVEVGMWLFGNRLVS